MDAARFGTNRAHIDEIAFRAHSSLCRSVRVRARLNKELARDAYCR